MDWAIALIDAVKEVVLFLGGIIGGYFVGEFRSRRDAERAAAAADKQRAQEHEDEREQRIRELAMRDIAETRARVYAVVEFLRALDVRDTKRMLELRERVGRAQTPRADFVLIGSLELIREFTEAGRRFLRALTASGTTQDDRAALGLMQARVSMALREQEDRITRGDAPLKPALDATAGFAVGEAEGLVEMLVAEAYRVLPALGTTH